MGVIMKQNQTAIQKLIELRDKETPEQRKAFFEAEQRHLAEEERIADLKLELYIADRYMK
jgi:hypothetical protein